MFNEITEENTLKIRSELINLRESATNHSYASYLRRSKKYIIDYINMWCPDIIKNHSNSTKIYWFINNIRKFPKCSLKSCGKPITRNVINGILGYTTKSENSDEIFCSQLCAKKSQHYISEQRNRIIERFGKINKKQTYPDWVGKNLRLRYTRRCNTYNKLMKSEIVRPSISLEEFTKIESIKTTKFKWKCVRCEHVFDSVYNTGEFCAKHNMRARCPKCYPTLQTSLSEKKLYRKLQKLNINGITFKNCDLINWRVLKHKQLDILAIDNKTNNIVLAIEFNGSIWHSIERGKSMMNQLSKTLECENIGIPLIHVWEDEWNNENCDDVLYHIKSVLTHTIDFESKMKDGQLILDRSKYPKTIVPEKYKLIQEIPPKIIKRANQNHTKFFKVPDCGMLVYKLSDGS